MITDYEYANRVSVGLDMYKVKSTNPFKANCRCPFCGDSQKSKYKARGWILQHPTENFYYYHCFNCGQKTSLGELIRQVDPNMAEEYYTDKKLEKFSSEERYKPNKEVPNKKIKKSSFTGMKDLKKVSQLRHNHPVKKYVTYRQIPENKHYMLYFSPKFNAWINKYLHGKLNKKLDEPRLVIPLTDKHGEVFGVVGRSFKKDSKMRYITIMFDETKSKVFGMDRLVSSEKYYVVEGPIDSMFLDNSIAMAGADINLNRLPDTENMVVVYDNQPRNKDVVKSMDKAIEAGYSVCIWPDYIEEKDINDMVKAGYDPKTLIDENTYRGLNAKLEFDKWRKYFD